MQLIDKRAALREQFPSLARVRDERPGCRADNARQAFYREENQLSVIAEQQARWAASVEANQARTVRANNRAANAAYKARPRRNESAA